MWHNINHCGCWDGKPEDNKWETDGTRGALRSLPSLITPWYDFVMLFLNSFVSTAVGLGIFFRYALNFQCFKINVFWFFLFLCSTKSIHRPQVPVWCIAVWNCSAPVVWANAEIHVNKGKHLLLVELNNYAVVEITFPEFVMESSPRAGAICGLWALENLAGHILTQKILWLK